MELLNTFSSDYVEVGIFFLPHTAFLLTFSYFSFIVSKYTFFFVATRICGALFEVKISILSVLPLFYLQPWNESFNNCMFYEAASAFCVHQSLTFFCLYSPFSSASPSVLQIQHSLPFYIVVLHSVPFPSFACPQRGFRSRNSLPSTLSVYLTTSPSLP